MLIKIIDDLNNGAYSAGSQYKMKRGIGCDETEKYFFSINTIWNRCQHHFIYGKKNRQYMQTGGFSVMSCTRVDPKKNRNGFRELFLIVVDCSPAR